jgi:PII-like signaling protein
MRQISNKEYRLTNVEGNRVLKGIAGFGDWMASGGAKLKAESLKLKM